MTKERRFVLTTAKSGMSSHNTSAANQLLKADAAVRKNPSVCTVANTVSETAKLDRPPTCPLGSSAYARSVAGVVSPVVNTDWPPRAVTMRVLDANGKEVHSTTKIGGPDAAFMR
jgi:hypothetical protein